MTYPVVSVVTPVYNGEPYLRECIESVLAQTYSNWNYTIVNNCSRDLTAEIAAEYAARDPRIHVHTNPHFVRAIANHNIAVRHISTDSQYCKIVAADDRLFPECLAKMVALAQANPTIGIVTSYGLRDGGRGIARGIIPKAFPYSDTCLSGPDICRANLLGGPYLFGQPTSVLYRADLVRSHDPFFNESNLHADAEVCFVLLRNSAFGFVPEVLTYIRTRDDSLSALSDRLNTYQAGNLYLLLKYGPVYLTQQEMQERLTARMRHYYAFLGRSAFGGRAREVWRFHASKLRDMGVPLDYFRLFRVVASTLVRRVSTLKALRVLFNK